MMVVNSEDLDQEEEQDDDQIMEDFTQEIGTQQNLCLVGAIPSLNSDLGSAFYNIPSSNDLRQSPATSQNPDEEMKMMSNNKQMM